MDSRSLLYTLVAAALSKEAFDTLPPTTMAEPAINATASMARRGHNEVGGTYTTPKALVGAALRGPKPSTVSDISPPLKPNAGGTYQPPTQPPMPQR